MTEDEVAWIIVEGPTCSGKSTLLESLQRRLDDRDINYIHHDRPAELRRRWVLEQYVLGWETLDPDDQHVIGDRWHWGEATYAPIYRPDTSKDGFGLLGVAGWRWTELFLASRGAVTVRLHAYDRVLIDRLRERGDDHVRNEDELVEVARLYREAAGHTASVVLPYDTGDEQIKQSEAVEWIVEVADKEERWARPLRRWRGYIGQPSPKVLLVGDERNITKRHGEETKLPFMPVNGNSGDFLLRALPSPFWRTVGVINGSEHIGTLKALWEDLGSPPVVALGVQAQSAVTRAGVPLAGAVPHPQHVRRFRTGKINEYGEAIRSAAETGKVSSEWTLLAR